MYRVSAEAPKQKQRIWDTHLGNRPDGEGRDEKEMRIDFERSGYHIIDSGWFHFAHGISPSDLTNGNFDYNVKLLTDRLTQAGGNVDNIMEDVLNPIWHILVTNYSENHKESHFIYNSYTDTNVLFTMGAMPIEINISGFVPVNPDYNVKLDFLAFYRFFLRGTNTRLYSQETDDFYKLPVGFTIGNTFMHLNITNLNIETTPDIPDFELINVSGIGYYYGNNQSPE